jgi:uncharacterized protein YbjT (DUF2867 family)
MCTILGFMQLQRLRRCIFVYEVKMAAKALVLGATGRTGQFLVKALQRNGATVRALVRDWAKAGGLLGPSVELVQGDLRDKVALRTALAGCDVVLFVAGANGGEGRGVPREIEYGAVADLVGVLDGASIERFVLLSSAAVTQPEHPHNCTFNSVLTWKLRGEDALRASGLPYTIVRALGLRDRPAGSHGGVRIVQHDRIAFGEDIAREDLGEFLADVVLAPAVTRFDPAFDPASLRNATCEIYNDGRVLADRWTCAQAALAPDVRPVEQAA